ncbi:mycothiol system anti-sigma-R factor [Streptomyces albus subsp. chlorinus]|uniref:mycothiol system anti-sigma-R factor n=1 Tax=Streptomyces albus TaxID=1888 RepID=UPI00156E58E2|nr:mycothiol system anti-sigma-R factor [Streptomyces albus]NSC23794.1 mycothiol system anti-sigma-R factor [Streptomyces albus subsp. chlorinus]
MSCGEPHETDCAEVLDHLYEYLDKEMPEGDCAKFEEHFDECSPCFEKYGIEREVKKLVKRCCGRDDVPTDLRAKVMGRIEVIRQGQAPQGADDPEPAPGTRTAQDPSADEAGQAAGGRAGTPAERRSAQDKNPA